MLSRPSPSITKHARSNKNHTSSSHHHSLLTTHRIYRLRSLQHRPARVVLASSLVLSRARPNRLHAPRDALLTLAFASLPRQHPVRLSRASTRSRSHSGEPPKRVPVRLRPRRPRPLDERSPDPSALERGREVEQVRSSSLARRRAPRRSRRGRHRVRDARSRHARARDDARVDVRVGVGARSRRVGTEKTRNVNRTTVVRVTCTARPRITTRDTPGSLAQLVERALCMREVAGSKPARSTFLTLFSLH